MLVYSKNINLFIKRYTREALLILENEVGLEVTRKYFTYNHDYYPVVLVVFEDAKKWGYFEPNFHQIGLNKNLLFEVNHELILNIIRHELAHYLVFLKFGDGASSHGNEFRELCVQLGWGKEVYGAGLDLSELSFKEDIQISKVREKIKKLMALQSSSNQFESELATTKVNNLLMKYNLESIGEEDSYGDDDEPVFVKRVLHGKRRSTKIDSIARILNEFFVHSVFNMGSKEYYLSVVGTKLNVETADYIAKFLVNEFDRLYLITKKNTSSLKGLVAKNNFFYGLAEGFIQSIKKSKQSIKDDDLILVSRRLENSVSIAYPKLSRTAGRRAYDEKATKLGQSAGANLKIRPGVTSNTQKLFLT